MAGIDTESTNPATSSRSVRVGQLLGDRYRLRAALASGGMAEVWEADDTVLDRRVAVKVLHPHLTGDPIFLERFRSEARLAARLSHPNIVSIFDTVSEAGVEAIVMELLEGVDLRAFLDQHQTLSPELTRHLGVQVADALQAAHQAGLVHRDIKPGNIMLVDDRRMKVTDFGIAKPDTGRDLTDHGTLIGTAKYLAPEQVAGGEIDGRADVYALGVVLFECLAGQPPFSGETTMATAMARLHRDPPRVRSVRGTVPSSLDAVIHRAMARDPEHRYANAAELRAALLAADDATILADTPIEVDALATTGPTGGLLTTERRWIVPTVLIVVIAVALGVAGTLIGTTDVGRSAVNRAREAVGLQEVEPSRTGTGSEDPVEIAAITTFDPEGTGPRGENDSTADLVADGDLTTAWTTESYDTRLLGGIKSGVGIIIELAHPTSVEALSIHSPTQGWAMTVYGADSPMGDLPGWGDPMAARTDIDGTVRVELDEPNVGALLVWITDLGDGAAPVRTQIDEITLFPG